MAKKNVKKTPKHNRLTSDECSQTTGERLASSVASHGGDALGADGGNTGLGGGNSAVGMGVNGGGGGFSTSQNRPSHHKYKYKSPKQFELKQS